MATTEPDPPDAVDGASEKRATEKRATEKRATEDGAAEGGGPESTAPETESTALGDAVPASAAAGAAPLSTAAAAHRERLRLGWIALAAALALIPLTTLQQLRGPDSAVEAVTAFMEAVHDKDLERAYTYTDASVPSGEEAAFLHPDAIGDWDLLGVEEAPGGRYDEDRVRVTIGTAEGRAEGLFNVDEWDGEWLVQNPFQQVTVTANAHTYLEVNDRVLPLPRETTWEAWYAGQAQRTITLLPGVYRFFGGPPVALLGESEEPPVVAAPQPEAGPDAGAALQAAVEAYVDDCAAYRLTAPAGCPFATDGLVDTADQRRMEEIEDVVWTVEEYPVAAVTEGTGWYEEPVLLVEFTEPGRLTLEGTGIVDYDAPREPFTTACRFGSGTLVVVADADGGFQLAPLGTPVTDTCRGTA